MRDSCNFCLLPHKHFNGMAQTPVQSAAAFAEMRTDRPSLTREPAVRDHAPNRARRYLPVLSHLHYRQEFFDCRNTFAGLRPISDTPRRQGS
jgi:hypothetical protein